MDFVRVARRSSLGITLAGCVAATPGCSTVAVDRAVVADQVARAIKQGDLISIEVADLEGPGVITSRVVRVRADGTIPLPHAVPVRAESLTPAVLERAIVAAYAQPRITEKMQTTVKVVEAR